MVIIPGADFELGGSELNDTRVVKTLLNLESHFKKRKPGTNVPCVVAELFDPRKVSIARRSISTSSEIIAGDRLISRLLSQSLRHSGVGPALLSLLTHREDTGLYLRGFPQFAGHSPRALINSFPKAVILGVVSMDGSEPIVQLNPDSEVILTEADRLIFLAPRYADCQPSAVPPMENPGAAELTLPPHPEPKQRRFLILGWSYKIPTLIAELLETSIGSFEITILSKIAKNDRQQALGHLEFTSRLTVRHVVGDYSLEQDLGKLNPHEFDHVLFLASGWLSNSEEADARTVMGLLLLRSLLEGHDNTPEVLTEVLDPDSAGVLGQTADVVFISPQLLSHLLAHVGLLPELNAVFDNLICSGGSEITLRMPADLGLDSNAITFAEVQAAAASRGCIGLGFYTAPYQASPRKLALNPDREQKRSLRVDDRIILLCSEGDGAGR